MSFSPFRAVLKDASTLGAGLQAVGARPVIFAPEGAQLSAAERDFFTAIKPFGFILFQRNCTAPQQLRELVSDLRACAGWHCPVLIDQEGGRVQRMKPPHWPSMPATAAIVNGKGEEEAKTATAMQAQALASMLYDTQIDVNCMPVADVVVEGITDNIIGDRAYGRDADFVAAMVRSFVCESVRYGMTPVMKHMPGHGRAAVDSHRDLPVVEAARNELAVQDFKPFRAALQDTDSAAIWGMVAHILFTDIDAALPSSLSPVIINDVIRGELGYTDSLLLTDDINMGALSRFGGVADITRETLAAGMDIVLHCSGQMKEMEAVATVLPDMSAETAKRAERWLHARADYMDEEALLSFEMSYAAILQAAAKD